MTQRKDTIIRLKLTRGTTTAGLGDVGYIRRGRFHLLFSAGCPLGSRQPGIDVPDTFEPLEIGHPIRSQPLLPGCLCTNTVKGTGTNLSASVSATSYGIPNFISAVFLSHPRFLEPGASFSFELTEKRGAALITNYHTHREDIEPEATFKECGYDGWEAQASILAPG